MRDVQQWFSDEGQIMMEDGPLVDRAHLMMVARSDESTLLPKNMGGRMDPSSVFVSATRVKKQLRDVRFVDKCTHQPVAGTIFGLLGGEHTILCEPSCDARGDDVFLLV